LGWWWLGLAAAWAQATPEDELLRWLDEAVARQDWAAVEARCALEAEGRPAAFAQRLRAIEGAAAWKRVDQLPDDPLAQATAYLSLADRFPEHPQVGQALLAAAALFERAGRAEEGVVARRRLDAATRDEDLRAQNAFALGLTLQQLGRLPEAADAFELAGRGGGGPERQRLVADARFDRALVLGELGDPRTDAAWAAFLAVAPADESTARVRLRLARLAAQEGRHAAVAKLATEALRAPISDPELAAELRALAAR
jgi:tetratricopeptide (TPR) repeat protein